MKKPFGYSLLIDMNGCCPLALDDLELHYRLLEELVFRLKMVPMTIPLVCHAPVEFQGSGYKDNNGNLQYYRHEKFFDKRGCSGWVGLLTSGTQIHSCVESRFSTIDIYSCNDFKEEVEPIKEFLKSLLKFESYEEHWIVRGINYNASTNQKNEI